MFCFRRARLGAKLCRCQSPGLLTLNGARIMANLRARFSSNAGLPEISPGQSSRCDSTVGAGVLERIISKFPGAAKELRFHASVARHTRALIQNDPDLANIERRLEEEKARQSSAD